MHDSKENKMKKYYLKRTSNQDVTRTVVVNSEAAQDFFGLDFKHKHQEVFVKIKSPPSKLYKTIKFVKKQDIRIFINKNFVKNDILEFTSQGNNCFVLKTIDKLSNRFRVYDSAIPRGRVNYLLTNHLPGKNENAGTKLENNENKNDIHEKEIAQRYLEGSREIIQLVKSRRGQGMFRDNVEALGSRCRITGVSDMRYLRASHIKPWRKSNDQEKLDGNNGLMLAPHIDMLFDSGLISFEDDGTLIISDKMDKSVLNAWSIDKDINVGAFSRKQRIYLKHHREIELGK